MRKTKDYREINESYFSRIFESLKHDPILLAVFDNTQIGIQQKFQRGGKSSLFLKMTAKMFVEMQHHWKGHDLLHDDFKIVVPITFLDQVIVSPYGMPCYEELLDRSPVFAIKNYDDSCFAPFHGSDATGKRVAAYVDHVALAGELQAQHRYLSRPTTDFKFLNERSRKAIRDSGLTTVLRLNRSNDGLYHRAHKFQFESVKKWKGQQTPVKLLCLPLSVDDETKTEECGNVLLSFMERSGIIKVRGKDTTSIQLADDYDSKWQLTVGDGLSQMRMRQYNDSVDAASVNFRQYYRQSIVFSKAMTRVLMIPGDLHGGGFHFLATVYLLYYGGLLQPLQYALGWKRIRGSDVTKTYQQCAALALLALGEIERGLYGAFIADIVSKQGLFISKHIWKHQMLWPRCWVPSFSNGWRLNRRRRRTKY
jgi:hypothetical protein